MSKQKAYYVKYSVTREETYRVTAASSEKAKSRAFEDGVYIGTDETTNAECINSRTAKHERARLIAGTEVPA